MTRLQTAKYCLLASTFVLVGILLSQLNGGAQVAHADLVVNRDNFTFMTARSSQTSEAIFVLDNVREKLLIYRADIGRKQIEFSAVVPLGGGPAARQGGGRRRGGNR